jgi:photosynthetic reaction center cytochrome c subunit
VNIKFTTRAVLTGVLALLGFAVAWTYERSETRQIGFDGVAMQVTQSRSDLEAQSARNVMPPSLPPAREGGARAIDTYQNVRVLGHLSTADFTRTMTAMTLWVAPDQGCAYCHNTENLASDELYPKVVARRMIQMTMHINQDWSQHVGVNGTGVTCFTCHRGNPVPEYIWFDQPPPDEHGATATRAQQNAPAWAAGLASLPGNAFETYLAEDPSEIRVQADDWRPGHRSSIKQTEWTYGLMVHFSRSLGVNCTYCHNSRQWSDWSQSPVTRTTAWYGIRMVRDINTNYLDSIQEVLPAHRLGPTGDAPNANCMTCHQGAYRPLLGQSMLRDYPVFAQWVEQPERTPPPAPPAPPPVGPAPVEGEGADLGVDTESEAAVPEVAPPGAEPTAVDTAP